MTFVRRCGEVLAGYLALAACNAFDEPAPDTRTIRIIPTDERAPRSTERTLPPVSGGTLLSFGSMAALVASDPSGDTLSVTFDGSTRVLGLPERSEPGRLAHLGGTQVAVVLRGTHRITAFDVGPEPPLELWSTRACAAPRGVAFEAHMGQLHVACADGHLVSLDARTGDVVRDLVLDSDLRDVVAADGRLYVSRFRTAEVLWIEDGALTRRIALPDVLVRDSLGSRLRSMRATVAWRMQPHPNGGVLVLHQRSALDTVGIDPDASELSEAETSPYGRGGADCSSIVHAAVTQVNADGAVLTSPSLARVILPVDVAIQADHGLFAVADAGGRDPLAPVPSVRVLHRESSFDMSGAAHFGLSNGIHTFHLRELQPTQGDAQVEVGCTQGVLYQTPSETSVPSTSVLFLGAEVVIQQPAAARLLRFRFGYSASTAHALDGGVGGSGVDTGHELFHRDAGTGIACASCHPEGTTDGHVWKFQGLGLRRTQNLAIPLKETAPFHWEGELPSVASLMDEVFVERMGGVFQSEQRLASLEHWLFTALRPVQLRETDDASERGRLLFESGEVGCASCHSGSALTDNLSHLVGTTKKGVRLQTPSLVGIAAHPPYLHDGCAKTLRERFNPDCGGGDEHGRTSHLSDPQLDDLVAYLETL